MGVGSPLSAGSGGFVGGFRRMAWALSLCFCVENPAMGGSVRMRLADGKVITYYFRHEMSE
jgi:hypothetical protein